MLANLTEVFIAAEETNRGTMEFVVGSGCILAVIVAAIWLAHRKK